MELGQEWDNAVPFVGSNRLSWERTVVVMTLLVWYWLLGYCAVVAIVAFVRAVFGRRGPRFRSLWENFLASFLRGVLFLTALAVIMFGHL
ncbi:hypothetical protein [Schleiferilactobacillus shenzhenensis]|uniref:hypothetical protein n=1 Tax=Schleiferilactobacillus shenzhenensis TaxID=1231337 RepID=UPI0012DF2259|nr:hypothetical protein [Schleiferilactobacillus shenzhenensis]